MKKKINLKVGNSVIVKPNVKDLDLEIDIGGWQGRISGIYYKSNTICLDWDSITLKNLPNSIIEKCEKQGWKWHQKYLELTNVELANPRDTKEDVAGVIDEIRRKTKKPKKELLILGGKKWHLKLHQGFYLPYTPSISGSILVLIGLILLCLIQILRVGLDLRRWDFLLLSGTATLAFGIWRVQGIEKKLENTLTLLFNRGTLITTPAKLKVFQINLKTQANVWARRSSLIAGTAMLIAFLDAYLKPPVKLGHVVWWLIIPFFPQYQTWRRPYLGLLAVAIAYEILAFVLPLWLFHEEMAKQKQALLEEADIWSYKIDEIRNQLEIAKTSEECEILKERLGRNRRFVSPDAT